MPFRNQNQSIQGLRTPNVNIGNMDWGSRDQVNAANFLTPTQANSGTAVNAGGSFNTVFNNQPGGGFDLGNFDMSQYGKQQPPGALGGWLDPKGKGGIGLGIAQIGLGAFNAMQQSKMNKFMRGYYGDQMDMMKADFTSAAKDANSRLQWQQQERIASRGEDPNSTESQQTIADYMSRWGAQDQQGRLVGAEEFNAFSNAITQKKAEEFREFTRSN